MMWKGKFAKGESS